jgi:regulator of protease activity HflC (stomatin/prohibitin superfamily)
MISIPTLAVVILILYLLSCIKVLAEYERGVVFRLGRVLPNIKGPGLIFVFVPIDRLVRLSLRIETLDVPSQDVVTRDNVTVKVNAVLFFRVIDPRKAILEVANYLYATSQLAQTTLRSVLGEVELDDLLSQREKINMRLQSVLDLETDPWGVKVAKVEVKAVDLPEQMIRAIARQAEAERERRAKVIHADGEYQAAERLSQAAELLQRQPAAIQLRYLQTLVELGSERSSTIVFPLPVDMLSAVTRAFQSSGPRNGGTDPIAEAEVRQPPPNS